MSKDLIQVLTAIKATLEEANQSGVITDTIWHGPGETLWDFIDNTIDRHRSSVESVELPRGDSEQLLWRCAISHQERWSLETPTIPGKWQMAASKPRSLYTASHRPQPDCGSSGEGAG